MRKDTGNFAARERPPFCLRKRNHSRDTIKYTLYLHISTDRKHTHYLHCMHCMDEYIHYTEGNICRPVQLTPVDLQRGKVKTLATVISLSQCAVKYNHSELEVKLYTLLY